MKYLLVLFLVIVFAIASPAAASQCSNRDGHQICIVKISRSAKNYWEYWAAVKIDGVETPVETYNCRDRIKTQSNGTVVRFTQNDAGDFVCGLFKR